MGMSLIYGKEKLAIRFNFFANVSWFLRTRTANGWV